MLKNKIHANMFNLCSAGLVAVLAAKESQAALYHINTRADDDSGLPESFVSFSIELSSFVDYAGTCRGPRLQPQLTNP